MKVGSRVMKTVACVVLAALCFGVSVYAAKILDEYDVHDLNRPLPPVVSPGEKPGEAPSDAIILFDGEKAPGLVSGRGGKVKWYIKDGYMEVPPKKEKAGGIRTKDAYGNCQLHVEWASPKVIKGSGQGRGNSGIYFMGKYEVQVLDSWTDNNYKNNKTYADGQAASIYGQHPPMVNACRKPGEWQSYDIIFLRPIFDKAGKVVRKARITVLHNGVVVHNNLEIEGETFHKKKARYSRHPDKVPISFQDHGNPVQYRNMWIRVLPEQPYLIKDQ